jgi:hypothetical protein
MTSYYADSAWSIVFAAVAGVIAALSAWFAKRSADTAERALEAQTRPLLTDVPHGSPLAQPKSFLIPGDREHRTTVSGEILVEGDEAWVSVPLRNVGNGVAKIETIELHGGGILLSIPPGRS